MRKEGKKFVFTSPPDLAKRLESYPKDTSSEPSELMTDVGRMPITLHSGDLTAG
jgi:hypothetical protein